MRAMTIGRAAACAGVRIATIRFYERRGLIERPRKPTGGFRVYPDETVARVRFIRQAQALGFSLAEIEGLLALKADPGAACAEVRERAVAKRDEVEDKIVQLARIRDALNALIAACPGEGALRACSILGVLAAEQAIDGDAVERRQPADA